MVYSGDQLLPISALQHLVYCPRQCALIHLEQAWAENRFTAEGKVLHKKAHEVGHESRPRIRTTRGLPVRSLEYGLSGQCDIVEFWGLSSGTKLSGGRLPDSVEIVAVEYKRGKPKAHRADEVQLCAQSLCLEEMFFLKAGTINHGLLFYGENRRRTKVSLDAGLRQLTADMCRELHFLIASECTPLAAYERKRCSACSLIEICEPKAMRLAKGTRTWFDHQLAALQEGDDSCESI